MNSICALLLQYLEEEKAFWSLASVLEKILPGYHSKTMSGLHTDQRVLDLLAEEQLPTLYEHLCTQSIDIRQFSTKWLVGLYTHSLPLPVVLHIWDCLLSIVQEGTTACRVLFGVSIALLSQMEEDLLMSDDPTCIVDQVQCFTQRLSSPAKQHAFFQSCCRTADHISSLNVRNKLLIVRRLQVFS